MSLSFNFEDSFNDDFEDLMGELSSPFDAAMSEIVQTCGKILQRIAENVQFNEPKDAVFNIESLVNKIQLIPEVLKLRDDDFFTEEEKLNKLKDLKKSIEEITDGENQIFLKANSSDNIDDDMSL